MFALLVALKVVDTKVVALVDTVAQAWVAAWATAQMPIVMQWLELLHCRVRSLLHHQITHKFYLHDQTHPYEF
jgi:hypothetical protein